MRSTASSPARPRLRPTASRSPSSYGPRRSLPTARPLTADDVVFSFNTLKAKGHPRFGIALRDVDKAEAPDAHTVRYTFKGDLTRDLPLVIAELPILSKAYYTAHPFDQTSLEPPLGSGPYAIGDFKAGTYVTLQAPPGLLGQGSPGQRRPLQLRRAALRLFPRPPDRTREPILRQRRPARGVHVARLGDRLRERAGDQGWPHPARDAARRAPLRHAGLFPQHAARAVQGYPRARGDGPRVRFRMVEQEPVLRPLQTHAELLRELADEGDRTARARKN